MTIKLIADSGATKCEWCLINNGKRKTIYTQGISPYFLDANQIVLLLQNELLPKLGPVDIENIYYYGTGLSNPNNVLIIKKALKLLFKSAKVEANTDLLAAARALCLKEKGIACILGTGSNSCYYNGTKIVKNSPGLGYILGDEGSGAFLGKKVVQGYLYNTFDEALKSRFDQKFRTNVNEILEHVYKKPLANRYLASFTVFLAENRGHEMVERIIKDGLNEFFFNHVARYNYKERIPVHFVGSVSFGFKDVLQVLFAQYELKPGRILKNPMQGLVTYHTAGV